jgi:hypothetical protein
LEATSRAKEAQQVILTHKRKNNFILYPKPTTPTPHDTPLKVQKLTHVEMVECHLKGVGYNCDEKYFPGHQCTKQKCFMAISEDVYDEYFVFKLRNLYPKKMILHYPLILPNFNL